MSLLAGVNSNTQDNTGAVNANSAAQLKIYYEKKLLSVLEPRLVLMPLGKKQRLPKGNGKTVEWLRYSTIAESVQELGLSPNTEGVPPSAIGFTTSKVEATIKQYGQYARVSDLLSDVALDPVLENLSERFGVAASKTIEQLIVSELDSATNANAIYASGAGDILSHKDLVEAMILQKADFIGPHESGDYVVVLHPFCEYDLLIDSQAGSFIDLKKGYDSKDTLNGEIGRMYGMRFLVSDKMTPVQANGEWWKRNYVIGEEAFGVVELNGDAMKMFVKRHGSAGAADPLDQFATVGYKIHGFATKYLDANSKRIMQLRSKSAIG